MHFQERNTQHWSHFKRDIGRKSSISKEKYAKLAANENRDMKHLV
jgi:hypothetical protein